MSNMAKKIVAAELMRWLETEQDIVCLTTSGLEDQIRIKQWGKWALLGESEKLGIKPQLLFKARTKDDISAWQAIVPLTDDEAMRVDASMRRLSDTERKIVKGLYVYWWSTRFAAEMLKIPRCQLLDRRDKALAFIAGQLAEKKLLTLRPVNQ